MEGQQCDGRGAGLVQGPEPHRETCFNDNKRFAVVSPPEAMSSGNSFHRLI